MKARLDRDQLSGDHLDRAVAECLGVDLSNGLTDDERYSTNWEHGGPLHRPGMMMATTSDGRETQFTWIRGATAVTATGPTVLIALCRCFVNGCLTFPQEPNHADA